MCLHGTQNILPEIRIVNTRTCYTHVCVLHLHVHVSSRPANRAVSRLYTRYNEVANGFCCRSRINVRFDLRQLRRALDARFEIQSEIDNACRYYLEICLCKSFITFCFREQFADSVCRTNFFSSRSLSKPYIYYVNLFTFFCFIF